MGQPIDAVATRTLPPRPDGSILTAPQPTLAEAWRLAGPRLERSLRRLGASEVQAQDIAQEVALRVIARRISFENVEDLLRWCNTTGKNLLIDQRRSTARHPTAAIEHAAGIADAADVEARVESRLRLMQVVRAFHELADSDKAALRTAVELGGEPPQSQAESTRLAVRRHRARARLRALAGGAIAALASVIARLKPAPRARWIAAATSVPAMLAVAALVVADPAASGPLPPDAPAAAPAPYSFSGPPKAASTVTPGGRVTRAMPFAPRPMPTPSVRPTSNESRLAAPAGGVIIGTGTRANPGNVLVCADPGPPIGRACARRPVVVPSLQPSRTPPRQRERPGTMTSGVHL